MRGHRFARSVQVRSLILLALGLVLPNAAPAQTNPPFRTGALRLWLVTAYEPCTSPNAIHNGAMTACTPPTRIDTVCGFGPQGKGTFSIIKRHNATPNMGATVRLTGLDAGCEGLQLCASTTTRTTDPAMDNCSGPLGCTLEDATYEANCCTVSAGTCVMRNVGVHLNVGPTVEAALLSCGIKRATGPSLPAGRTFDCGLFHSIE